MTPKRGIKPVDAVYCPKKTFLHVVDSHRWLAASGCAWNLVGPNATQTQEKEEAHRLLPNIDVMVRDCLLLHARSLIDFYTNKEKKNQKDNNTDILLRDFGGHLTGWNDDKSLKEYRKSIELHLLHLTAYRDDNFRAENPIKNDLHTARQEWDDKAAPLVEKLHACLKSVAEAAPGGWAKAFCRLYEASIERFQDKSSQWPSDLREKSDVEQYLTSLGL